MKTSEVKEFYKTQAAIAEALGITQPSVAEWKEEPPEIRQVQLEILTGGKLKASPGCWGPRDKPTAPSGRRAAN